MLSFWYPFPQTLICSLLPLVSSSLFALVLFFLEFTFSPAAQRGAVGQHASNSGRGRSNNMGIFRSSFSFSLGAMAGVYVAQNYTIPNLKTFVTTGLVVAKQMENQFRKPPKDGEQ